ncbi:DUF1015 domain-containing protein [bacterium]|nr:MAG: DUF1015 domain-containing protein [bacterium]
MSDIIPFKGLLYNSEKVGDLKMVMAPPYDVISPKYQDELYSRHPYNIVKLILSKDGPSNAPGSDRYSLAANDLGRWINDKTLVRDDKPAIYYYMQTYRQKGGTTHTRKGFIALARLEEFGKGKIHAHEQTLSGPKADRLRLMQACESNLSCIFSLYSEPELTINRLLDGVTSGVEPLIDAPDDDGTENKLWRIDDTALITKVIDVMHAKPLFIADGHHRYETALNFRNYMKEKHPDSTGEEAWNYVMMYFSNMDDEGMTIWPTHRVVHSINGFNPEEFLKECAKYFDVEDFKYEPGRESTIKMNFLNRIASAGKGITSFGLHIKGDHTYYVLVLKSKDVMTAVFGSSIPDVFKTLDVTVLHALILSKILGITKEAQAKQENLIYVKNSEEAIEAVNKDSNQMAFLLNSTKIEQVKAVALAGHVMPQKSTYFYPKLLTGLVMNLLTDKFIRATQDK